jgi:hypothetical protein
MTAGRSGKLLKTVSVFSNDPKKPIAQLNIAIDIDAPDGGVVSPQPAQYAPASPASRPRAFALPGSAPGVRRAPPALPAQSLK